MAYVISDAIRQITKDNSLMQEMLDSGKLLPEDAKNFPYKNVITRALGIEEHIEIDFSDVVLFEGEKLLLCSDGLTNYLSDEEILSIVNDSDTESVSEKLVEAANRNGGGDNITVVVITK